MAKIASGGSLSAVADTAIESTAALRYIRVHLCNAAAVTRTVQVKFGAQRVVKDVAIAAAEDREFGPYTVGAAETVKAWQDVGTDVEYRVTGES